MGKMHFTTSGVFACTGLLTCLHISVKRRSDTTGRSLALAADGRWFLARLHLDKAGAEICLNARKY